MKCHYEVLHIEKEADDAQIKTAYRRLALKWHPDKNLETPENAKAEFQLVQQAYEVLSDRQERAWYDKHREQILCGNNSEFKESNLNIFQYFTSTCFKGYGDDANGFYTIYRKAFDEIIQDDIRHMLDKDELLEVPSFGTSTSDYEEIAGPFYDYWASYTTKKSFAWLDHYNMQEVRDRRVFKLVEKEHKKIRQKAKKEWNEEVRALVAFVRKRDKRVKEYVKQREAIILQNRQKNENLSKQKRLERNKLLNESHNSEAEWTKFDNVKDELVQIEKSLAEEFGEQISEYEDDVSEPELSNLYCVACNKVFKSTKAFENHELSKKHKENVSKLKDLMEDEACDNEELSDTFSEQDLSDNNKEIIYNGNLSSDSVETLEKSSKHKKKQKKVRKTIQENVNEDHIDVNNLEVEHSDDDFKFEQAKKPKNKKPKTSGKQPEQNGKSSAQFNQEERIKIDDIKPNNKSHSKKPNEHSNDYQNIYNSNCCATCKTDFPSKNKLFSHLKKTGHSVYLEHMMKSVKSKKMDK